MYVYIYMYMFIYEHVFTIDSEGAMKLYAKTYIYILYSKNGFLRRNAAAAMFSPLKVAGHFSPRNHHPDHPVIRDGF